MHEVFRRLREIPLDVAAQSRMVVENAQRDRPQPLAALSEHVERTVVEIEVPQRPDILGFVAADLACLAPSSARTSPGRRLGRGVSLRTKPCACM